MQSQPPFLPPFIAITINIAQSSPTLEGPV
jgi:hypothetical protein